MSVTSKFKIIVLLFISFFMVINISSAMTFTDGQTVDTTRMLESNDVWVHNIPFSGTARITVEMNVVEGEDVDFILFRNASYDEYIRNTLVQSPRELAIDRLIGYCALTVTLTGFPLTTRNLHPTGNYLLPGLSLWSAF